MDTLNKLCALNGVIAFPNAFRKQWGAARWYTKSVPVFCLFESPVRAFKQSFTSGVLKPGVNLPPGDKF